MTELEIGQLVSGTVADLRPFGAFVDLGGITALLHINNVSQKYVASLQTALPIGTALKAIVTDIDEQRGRISLSTSVLENYPGEMLDALTTVMVEAEVRVQRQQQTESSGDGEGDGKEAIAAPEAITEAATDVADATPPSP
jgi:small subunit ribosomal protein S1